MDENIREEILQENKMGTMPVGRLLFSMAVPMMVSMLFQALYNVVDSIFVAKLSQDAMNAVSLAFPLQTLCIAFSGGTGVGMNALLSRSLGEKNQAGADRAALLTDLQKSFGACVDLGAKPDERDEHAALTDEAALEELLERGALSDDTLAALISARKIFPCCFGSALKNEGVAEFLQLLTRFTRRRAARTSARASLRSPATRRAHGSRT